MADAAQANQTVQNAGQTRPTRAQAERTERRRRKGGSVTGVLEVTDEIKAKLAAEGMEGRWINDVDNRMHDKTKNDDWDKVPGVEPRQVGVDKRTNQPIIAHFCAKRKDFLEEDRREKLDAITERERAIVRGTDDGTAVEGSYQPKSQNRIGNTI